MPLPRYLTRPLSWLRAGYPAGASPHGDVPLIALAPSPAAQSGSPNMENFKPTVPPSLPVTPSGETPWIANSPGGRARRSPEPPIPHSRPASPKGSLLA